MVICNGDGVEASPSGWAKAIVGRGLFFGLLWWILTEGRSSFSWLGLVGILAAVALSMRLTPAVRGHWRFAALVRFVPFFLWQSLLGGLDVAQRALRPQLNLHPVVIRYRFRLRQEPARVLFVWVVSLLPGTAGIDLQGDQAAVHVLDSSLADQEKLRKLETRIAELFESTPRGESGGRQACR
jgi:multicomponent Na+:H+ antiporter subunit E